jgi:protein involved in polysaccharide export with SLBB domain
MPMIQPVKILGLSTKDAAAAIAKVLTATQVTVSFVHRARMRVFVVGHVKAPGPISIDIGDRVIQAIAQAGYDKNTDLSHVSVRSGLDKKDLDLTKYLKGEDLTVNIELHSGDTIVVGDANTIGTIQISGKVAKIGPLTLTRGMTFRDAIGLVGGVTIDADTDNIKVRRDGVTDLIHIDYKHAMDGDPSADIILQPGDAIYVPELETSFFTVIGAVNKPGQIPLKGKLTISEAIGLAGGQVPNASNLHKITIIRATEKGKNPQLIRVDLVKMIDKGQEQPIIQRGDTIYVKEKVPDPSIWQELSSIASLGWLISLL